MLLRKPTIQQLVAYLVSLTGAINLLFGLIIIVNWLKIGYYFFYSSRIIQIAIFSPTIDWYLWAVSLVVLVAQPLITKALMNTPIPRPTVLAYLFLSISFASFMGGLGEAAAILMVLGGLSILISTIVHARRSLSIESIAATMLIFISIFCILIPVEAGSSFLWIVNAFDPTYLLGPDPRSHLPLIDLQLFNAAYPSTLWILLTFLTTWIWIPVSKRLIGSIKKALPFKFSHSAETIGNVAQGAGEKPPRIINKVALLFSVIAGMFLAYYPHFQHKDSMLYGVDAYAYHTFLTRMGSEGVLVAFQYDRPLFLLILRYIQVITAQPSEVILKVMPLIIAPLLSLAAFWFVKTGTRNEGLAALASIFTAFSFHTTVGMYAHIIANWFTMALVFLCLTFCLKSWENSSGKYGVLAILTFFITLFTHAYTWMVLLSIVIGYALLSIIILGSKAVRGKRRILFPIAVFLASVITCYTYAVSPLSYVVSFFQHMIRNLSVPAFIELKSGLLETLTDWVGGFFANWLIYLLATLGMTFTTNIKSRFHRILAAWITLSSIALILTARAQELQWRALYVMPFQIPAAIGTYNTLNWIEKKFILHHDQARGYFSLFRNMLILLIILFLFNYSLRSMNYVLPHSA